MSAIKKWTVTIENIMKNDMKLLSAITRIPMRLLIDEAIEDLLKKHKNNNKSGISSK